MFLYIKTNILRGYGIFKNDFAHPREPAIVTYFMWFKVPTSSDKLTNKIWSRNNWDIAKKCQNQGHWLYIMQPSNMQIYLSMNQLFTNCFLQGWHCSYSSFILVPVFYRLAADIKVQIVRWLKISIILFLIFFSAKDDCTFIMHCMVFY